MKEKLKTLLQNSVRVDVPYSSTFEVWNGTLARFKVNNDCLIIYNYLFIVKRSYAPGEWKRVFIWKHDKFHGADL